VSEIDDIVSKLLSAPSDMAETGRKAAELILRMHKQLEDLRAADSRFAHKMERNATILKRRANGERTKDLAEEYGISPPMVSKIVQRERDRLRKEKGK
jgi:Mn-dependent DtxR family transcriptional regulator